MPLGLGYQGADISPDNRPESYIVFLNVNSVCVKSCEVGIVWYVAQVGKVWYVAQLLF